MVSQRLTGASVFCITGATRLTEAWFRWRMRGCNVLARSEIGWSNLDGFPKGDRVSSFRRGVECCSRQTVKMGISLPSADFRLVSLDALVRMKLTAFRDKDRTHLRDLIEVGLVDATWVPRLPSELAMRLQKLLDTPEG